MSDSLEIKMIRPKSRPSRLASSDRAKHQLYIHLSHHICRITFATGDTARRDLIKAL
jgi:hypothetical protein